MKLAVQFTDKDFIQFCRTVRAICKRNGITEWDISFVFGLPADADSDSMVCTRGNYQAMSAIMYFPRTLDSDDVLAHCKSELITLCARHEVAEILTLPLQVLAQSRDFDAKILEAENHRLIHRLENIL